MQITTLAHVSSPSKQNIACSRAALSAATSANRHPRRTRRAEPKRYAGAAFQNSPDPSALPVPLWIHNRREGGARHAGETASAELRRLLNLMDASSAVGYGGSFKTDENISRGSLREGKELQRWMADGDVPEAKPLDSHLSECGTGHWDQFEANARLYGVQTTFDEELYTTKLPAKNLELEKHAAELARMVWAVCMLHACNIHMLRACNTSCTHYACSICCTHYARDKCCTHYACIKCFMQCILMHSACMENADREGLGGAC